MIKKICILFVVVVSVGRQVKAQTWVVIPDSIFVICLQNYVPAAMHHDSLNTSSPLVTTTTHSINVSNKNIHNLFGIQYFTSLTYLDCASNYLTNLPSLPNTLIYLNCGSNSLTNLPSLPNSLTYIECGGNSLTSLPTLPNNLQSLYCEINSLTSLPLLPTSLQALWCQDNNITCFPVFSNSITSFVIDPNPYYCLPNYISAMSTAQLALPLCAAGNSNNCPVAATGISQISGLNTQIAIYPNPNNGSFVIETNAITKQTVMVYDVSGKLVLSQTINGKTNIDAGSLSEGVYNISISSSEGVLNKKIVIVK